MHRDQTMRKVVAYMRIKQWKILRTSSKKIGSSLLGEFVVYKWLQMGKFFFCVLDSWSLMGGGRTWVFDCAVDSH